MDSGGSKIYNMKEGTDHGKCERLVLGAFFLTHLVYTCIPYTLKLSGRGCMMARTETWALM